MDVVLKSYNQRVIRTLKYTLLTWKFHGKEIPSSSLGRGGTASKGVLLVVGGDLGLRFGNLKKVDAFLFFCPNSDGSAGEDDLADAAEDASDMDD